MKVEDYININLKNDTLILQLKGFWTEAIVDQVGASLVEQFKNAVNTFKKSKFIVLADLSEFGQPSAKAKGYIGTCMKYGIQNNMYKSVQVLPKATIKMGIDKTVKEAGEDNFRVVVKTIEEAHDLIADLKKDLLA